MRGGIEELPTRLGSQRLALLLPLLGQVLLTGPKEGDDGVSVDPTVVVTPA